MEKLRVFEAFAGYGSQSMALERLGIDFEVIGISEIDKYAIEAYMAVHGETKNYGDISKIDWNEVPDFDFFTYSFPCQDISSAGEQKGLEEGSGTRSSLLWECKKVIEAKKPKYLLMENVKALTSKKFKPYLNKWTAYLEGLGYTCHTKILNSKDYGVPQNRDRCFMVSILGDESFFFPEGFPLETRLKDVLEKNVDEKYYLSKKLITGFLNTSNNPNHCHKFTPKDGDDIAFTIRTKAGSRVDNNFIKVETESVYGNKRVQSLVESGKIDGDHVQFLDAYNQAVSDDVAGTIRTTIDSSCMHFVTEPKLRRIGNIYGDKCGSNFAGNVYDKEGISPTLTSMTGGNREPMIIEPLNADKEGLARTIKAQYYKNGMANLKRQDGCGATGVIEISEPVAIGYTRDKKGKIIKRHAMDVVNTIHTSTGQGGNTDCLIAEPNVLTPKRTEYGKAIRKEYESGKLEESRHNMTEMQPRTDGVSNTITTVQKDNLLVETMPEGMASQSYRIRKLTPRECFRLMGVSDSDIDKIEKAGISRTQQYRMAGNSIVVDVLCHIFRKMFIEKECESVQLSLF